MTEEDVKIINMAKGIQEYCRSKHDCNECVFAGCILTFGDDPVDWELPNVD